MQNSSVAVPPDPCINSLPNLRTILEKFYIRPCLVSSRYTYASPVWRPDNYKDSMSHLQCMQNRAVCLTCGFYGSMAMYHSVEHTLGGFPYSSLYSAELFSPCLVNILMRVFCCSHQYTLVINIHTELGAHHVIFHYKLKKNFSFNTKLQCSGVLCHLVYLMIISNFHDGLLQH